MDRSTDLTADAREVPVSGTFRAFSVIEKHCITPAKRTARGPSVLARRDPRHADEPPKLLRQCIDETPAGVSLTYSRAGAPENSALT